ncbi:MAG: transglutaminase-like domain-containing protein, partial [Alphaproteobacteria bacterium]|nr:transglutaminase-like domain-containing protein [Alphaproteobacteria bacterium]
MSEATSIEDFEPYLQPGIFIDSDHPAVVEFSHRVAGDDCTDLEKAVQIYYAVRDEFRYDPYDVEMTELGMKGSTVLERGNGFCITKGTLMAA